MSDKKAKKYAEWLVANEDKKGTPEFETVAAAYKQARAGVSPQKASAPKQGPSLATRGEAALRGVTSGFFGVGDYAAAAGDVAGQLVSRAAGLPSQPLGGALGRVRERREELETAAPLASAAGNVAGALVPISRAGALLKTGQPIANTLRTAGAGAAQGAVTELNLGGDLGDIATAGGVSGLASPAVGAVVRGAGGVVNFGRSVLDRNKDAGFRALARALTKEGDRVSPTQLRSKAEEFRRVTGRGPSITEIVGQRGGQDVLQTVQGTAPAVERLLSSAEQQAAALQGNLASEIAGGRVTTGAPRLLERRGASMDAFMQKKDRFGKAGRDLGSREISLDEQTLADMLDPDIYRALPPVAKRKVLAISEGSADEPFTLRDLDNVRQAFRKVARGGGEATRFNHYADNLSAIGADQVPEYKAALGEFARRSRTAEGVEFGASVRNAPTREFEQTAERLAPEELAGARVGQRTALTDTALQSPQQAAALAASLAEDAGLGRRIAAVDAEEAARLRELGQTETEALRSVAGTVRGARLKSASQEDTDNAKAALEAVVLASGRASGGFQATFFSRLVNRYKVPPTAAKRLAEAVTDPARTDEAIQILERLGVSSSEIERIARAAARATGKTAGPAATQEQAE